MKLWILSDLHQDFGRFDITPPEDAEVAVVAGDVQNDDLLMWLGNRLPTVFVAGNHEFYGHFYHERMEQLKSLPSEQLYVLDNEVLTLGDVRFIGATLWTDYGRNPVVAEVARRGMNDHRLISWSKHPWQRFLPSHATKMHDESRAYIEQQLATSWGSKTVVVTHHAPSEKSVARKFEGSVLNRAYYSNLDGMIESGRPHLWVHGHTHASFEYMIGETRIICNPHGYPDENANFDPQLVVEV